MQLHSHRESIVLNQIKMIIKLSSLHAERIKLRSLKLYGLPQVGLSNEIKYLGPLLKEMTVQMKFSSHHECKREAVGVKLRLREILALLKQMMKMRFRSRQGRVENREELELLDQLHSR